MFILIGHKTIRFVQFFFGIFGSLLAFLFISLSLALLLPPPCFLPTTRCILPLSLRLISLMSNHPHLSKINKKYSAANKVTRHALLIDANRANERVEYILHCLQSNQMSTPKKAYERKKITSNITKQSLNKLNEVIVIF